MIIEEKTKDSSNSAYGVSNGDSNQVLLNKCDCEYIQDTVDKNNNQLLRGEQACEQKHKLHEKFMVEEYEKMEHMDFIYKEGGWGWIVVVATGYCFGILIGMINNYALIYNELDSVYNGTVKNHVVYCGWIGSSSLGVQYILCFFGSALTDMFGPRKIGILGGIVSTASLFASVFVTEMKLYFLTYGLGFGVGQALLLTATLAILPHYFNKKLALANGLMNLIAAVIFVVLPYGTSYVIKLYSLNGLFYFLTAINLGSVLMAFTFIPLLPVQKDVKMLTRIKDSFGVEVLKKIKFLCWCIGTLIAMFGYLIPVYNIDHHSVKAFPNEDPVIIQLVFGISTGLSALLFGFLGDFTKFNRVHYHTLVFFVYGIVQIMIPFAPNFIVFLFQMTILGIMDGVLLCFIVPISYDLTKSSKLANHASGYYHVIMSPTAVAGAPVAGLIYETWHSYDYAFYLGGLTCVIGAFFMSGTIILINFYRRILRKRRYDIQTNNSTLLKTDQVIS